MSRDPDLRLRARRAAYDLRLMLPVWDPDDDEMVFAGDTELSDADQQTVKNALSVIAEMEHWAGVASDAMANDQLRPPSPGWRDAVAQLQSWWGRGS